MLAVVDIPDSVKPDTYTCIGRQIMLPGFIRSRFPHHVFISDRALVNKYDLMTRYIVGSHMHIWINSRFSLHSGKIFHFYDDLITIKKAEDFNLL